MEFGVSRQPVEGDSVASMNGSFARRWGGSPYVTFHSLGVESCLMVVDAGWVIMGHQLNSSNACPPEPTG